MKIGIICDMTYPYSVCFSNYYYSLVNLFGPISIVKNLNDLECIDVLFVGNDHFGPHKDVWMNSKFIDRCNEKNIKFVVFTAEKILSSWFPWNSDIQKNLEKFKYLYQYVIDIDDSIELKKPLMKGMMSKQYKNVIEKKDKINKCIFIGKYKEIQYENRRRILKEVGKIIDLEVDEINYNTKWIDYMNKISEYRFVLSPLSTGNFFPLRFYEILLAHSIPIQEVKNNTLDFYETEKQFDDCIYFENIDELKNKLVNFKLKESYNEIWMEEHISNLLKNVIEVKI